MAGVRVGFLGTGFIAVFHARMLSAVPDADISVVFDPDHDRARAFAERSGAEACRSVAEVVARSDAVFVCAPTAEHPALVAAAVEHGAAVFCEKPLGRDLAEARVVAARLADAPTHQVGLVLRHSPAFGLVEAIIGSGELGRVASVVFRDDQYLPMRSPTYRSSWRGDPAQAGAGVLLEHSIHDLDLLDRLVGPIEIRGAVVDELAGYRGIDDAASVVFDVPAGGSGVLATVWHDLSHRESTRRLDVFFERGLLSVDGDWFGPVTVERDGGERVVLAGDELLAECARRGVATPNPDGVFVEAVRDGRQAFPDAAVALRAHELVDAAYRMAGR